MGKKEREEWMLRNGVLLLEKRISYFDGRYSNPIRCFSAKELQKATDNYRENLFFGYEVDFIWYKGCLEGRVILVKKSTDKYRFFRDPEMVTNEISVAAQLSGHKNSLKLLGCCLETQIPTLIFEFPMNRNLKYQLQFNPTCLSWKSRLKIANEIAITYLHTAFPRPIIHRDIHPGHFCLDQDLCAKLSDFIFSMSIPEGKTQVENEVVYGTKGYAAPEVLVGGVYSEKSDVFDFGLLLFNLLTGKDYCEIWSIINDFKDDPKEDDPKEDDPKEDSEMDCIESYIKNHGINGIVDPTILAEGGVVHHHHQFQAVFRLILKCCRWNAEERPIMLDAAKQLRRIQRIETNHRQGVIIYPKRAESTNHCSPKC